VFRVLEATVAYATLICTFYYYYYYYYILLLIIWVCSFSNMQPSVKFAEDEVLVFVILREKC